jgi:hypothetical protein
MLAAADARAVNEAEARRLAKQKKEIAGIARMSRDRVPSCLPSLTRLQKVNRTSVDISP